MKIPRPNANTYWVTERFLAGEYPRNLYADSQSAQKLAAYLEAGVEVFVNLTCDYELEPYEALVTQIASSRGLPEPECHRHEIVDRDVPTVAQMAAILDRIDAALADRRGVYVHCWGGVGRTGTVVGCYLVRHGQRPEQAIATLAQHWSTVEKRSRHPKSPETAAQLQFIHDWPDRDPML